MWGKNINTIHNPKGEMMLPPYNAVVNLRRSLPCDRSELFRRFRFPRRYVPRVRQNVAAVLGPTRVPLPRVVPRGGRRGCLPGAEVDGG